MAMEDTPNGGELYDSRFQPKIELGGISAMEFVALMHDLSALYRGDGPTSDLYKNLKWQTIGLEDFTNKYPETSLDLFTLMAGDEDDRLKFAAAQAIEYMVKVDKGIALGFLMDLLSSEDAGIREITDEIIEKLFGDSLESDKSLQSYITIDDAVAVASRLREVGRSDTE